MIRQLSEREHHVLVAMIEHAGVGEEGPDISSVQRSAWRATVPHLQVYDACNCGDCPSVSLTSNAEHPNVSEDERVVLVAALNDALVLVFVDDDVPSYLELAPHNQETAYTQFPEPAALSF